MTAHLQMRHLKHLHAHLLGPHHRILYERCTIRDIDALNCRNLSLPRVVIHVFLIFRGSISHEFSSSTHTGILVESKQCVPSLRHRLNIHVADWTAMQLSSSGPCGTRPLCATCLTNRCYRLCRPPLIVQVSWLCASRLAKPSLPLANPFRLALPLRGPWVLARSMECNDELFGGDLARGLGGWLC